MAVTEYTWNPLTDSVIEEADGAGNVLVEYTNEPAPYGPLISERRGSESRQYHFDALGSTQALTDNSENVTDAFTYDAWGIELVHVGSNWTSYMWNGWYGYRTGASHGIHDVRMRQYSSALSRFLSLDRFLFSRDQTRYRYSINSPIELFDPSGLLWEQQGTSSIWKATADGDDLVTLAMMVSTIQSDWVCIWPVPDPMLWQGYPSARSCAKADVANLTSQPTSIKKAAVFQHGASTDNYLRALKEVFGGGTFFWKDGISAAEWFKKQSGQGKNPIGTLWLGGHGNGASAVLADKNGEHTFSPADVFKVADEPSNSTNSYRNASRMIGPPRCWLTPQAKAYLAGCWTSMTPMEAWAGKIARVTSTVYGSPVELFGRFSVNNRRGSHVYFDGFDQDRYFNVGQFGASPHWESRGGSQ